MGRKPISGIRKYGRMVVMLNDEERETLDRAAEIVGKPTSTWMRDEILKLAQSILSSEKKTTPKKKTASRKK